MTVLVRIPALGTFKVFSAIDYNINKFTSEYLIDHVKGLCIDEPCDPQANEDADQDQEDEIDEEITAHRPTEKRVASSCTVQKIETTTLDVLFEGVDPLIEQETPFADERNTGVIGPDLRFLNFCKPCYVALGCKRALTCLGQALSAIYGRKKKEKTV